MRSHCWGSCERWEGNCWNSCSMRASQADRTNYQRRSTWPIPRNRARPRWIRCSPTYSRNCWNATADPFWTAYRYIQSRTKIMRYSDYTSVHIPLGSGVTEAACKTVFTQRLKNSGMRWGHDGAKMILTLRTILLSRSWAATYSASLKSAYPAELRPYRENKSNTTKTAA